MDNHPGGPVSMYSNMFEHSIHSLSIILIDNPIPTELLVSCTNDCYIGPCAALGSHSVIE